MGCVWLAAFGLRCICGLLVFVFSGSCLFNFGFGFVLGLGASLRLLICLLAAFLVFGVVPSLHALVVTFGCFEI